MSTAVVSNFEEKLVRFRFDAEPIDRLDRMYGILKDAANAGRTFHVTEEVFEHFRSKLRITATSAEGIARINELLGTTFSLDSELGMEGDCVCPNCGHNLSFADHIESVVRMGLHHSNDIRLLLSGERGFFLTVAKEEEREMVCPRCEVKSRVPRRCYGTSSYAYCHAEQTVNG